MATCRGAPHEERGEEGSTFAVFARASDALACALEVQRAIEREGWPGGLRVKVRVALHAGEVEPEGSDWRGVAVIRCAAIRALAHGGQVLVSAAVRELAGEDLPPGASLRDLGRAPAAQRWSVPSTSSSSSTPTCRASSRRFDPWTRAATTCCPSSPASSGESGSSTSSRRCSAAPVSSP